MDKWRLNHKNVQIIILVVLSIEILPCVIYFMIGKSWGNYNIFVTMSRYVPMSQHVPVSHYVPPMMRNIHRLFTTNNHENPILPQIKGNKSQVSKGTTRKYRTSFRPQNVYFPGDPLPEKQLDAIRKLSDTKLKRRLTYKQCGVLKNMLEEVVQMFIKDNIR